MPEDDLDLEELSEAVIIQALTETGGYQITSQGRADALKFFLGGQFEQVCDALQISDGTRERITALARLRNRNARQRQFGR